MKIGEKTFDVTDVHGVQGTRDGCVIVLKNGEKIETNMTVSAIAGLIDKEEKWRGV